LWNDGRLVSLPGANSKGAGTAGGDARLFTGELVTAVIDGDRNQLLQVKVCENTCGFCRDCFGNDERQILE
jgi:hypothetical protein